MGICKSVSFTKKVYTTTVSVIDKRLIVRKKPVNNMGRGTGSKLDRRSANTIVYALSAGSAAGAHSANTVVGALGASGVAGAKSASTVVSAVGARSAVGLKSASTVVNEIIVRFVTPLDT